MEKLQKLGDSSRYEINVICWEEKDLNPRLGELIYGHPVVDVRAWSGEEPRNGVCLSNDMVIALLIHAFKSKSKPDAVLYSGNCGGIDFFMYEKIATLRKLEDRNLLLSRCSFKSPDQLRYDLRYWDQRITRFTPGAAMTEDEFNSLCMILCDYVDHEGLEVPRLPQMEEEGHLTLDDLILQMLLLMDKSYIVGSPVKLKALKERIIEEIKRV